MKESFIAIVQWFRLGRIKYFVVQPFIPIYEYVDEPTKQTTVVDVLTQVVKFVGAMIVVVVLAGIFVATLLIAARTFWPDNPFNGAGASQNRLDL